MDTSESDSENVNESLSGDVRYKKNVTDDDRKDSSPRVEDDSDPGEISRDAPDETLDGMGIS